MHEEHFWNDRRFWCSDEVNDVPLPLFAVTIDLCLLYLNFIGPLLYSLSRVDIILMHTELESTLTLDIVINK